MSIQMQATGSVERDPELHLMQDGTPVTEFSLVVNTKRCVEDITVWLFCYAWGDQAETIQRSVTKGSMLFVQGHFTPHRYMTEDGKQEVSLEVNVEKFSLADGNKPQEHVQQSGTGSSDTHKHSETLLSYLKAVLPTLLRSYPAGQAERKECARKMPQHLSHLNARKYEMCSLI